ncbi:MAG: hypothetical protein NVS1B11_28960 [Terriglobales bacterium]
MGAAPLAGEIAEPPHAVITSADENSRKATIRDLNRFSETEDISLNMPQRCAEREITKARNGRANWLVWP